ncbi:UDP-perosamine 4-acetyltransferase [Marinobacter nauticus]|uniref:UDP-perosamine 4-acetyltransferase n=1 Tax=Marinobacter nauticus TaxID=2743 RepID=A0A368XT72_MARNT|nr:acetyltransferase [Marinobacter nauticus]RCW71163.1 UDP-perosamine 4-acetyltransferase [Marinobacter nauticus]
MSAKIILLGAGGHARVVLDALLAAGLNVNGVVDPSLAGTNDYWRGVPVLGNDQDLLELPPHDIELVNGIGSIPGQTLRKEVFRKFTSAGFNFRTVIHPSAIIGSEVKLMPGAQLMAGAIVQADSLIGENTIVNTGARVDHDCSIGSDVHIAPGAVVSGGVQIGVDTHIGTGASIIQGIILGKNVLVGAGTAVVRDVPDDARIVGPSPKITSRQGME